MKVNENNVLFLQMVFQVALNYSRSRRPIVDNFFIGNEHVFKENKDNGTWWGENYRTCIRELQELFPRLPDQRTFVTQFIQQCHLHGYEPKDLGIDLKSVQQSFINICRYDVSQPYRRAANLAQDISNPVLTSTVYSPSRIPGYITSPHAKPVNHLPQAMKPLKKLSYKGDPSGLDVPAEVVEQSEQNQQAQEMEQAERIAVSRWSICWLWMKCMCQGMTCCCLACCDACVNQYSSNTPFWCCASRCGCPRCPGVCCCNTPPTQEEMQEIERQWSNPFSP